ncbi:MAG: BON domain-containing protein [Candidatus Eremiobacteraeota bacterium]|nr:BON domain-containing protein [Candidatus Eremiobacteraeota bacterium]MBV8333630.1 BON domain-containing protein [Candidatus Eremiobacteraeota bacterium]MBV8434698.1 BON domain-containing protein [Candidatus Eremiobacteraeota bacterium]MBV8656038.1 BON domain-containing protein [Candidatus Eremiobacteraeota bacterium]MBV8721999.1 BON domain-containing protein [Candidatus Eremiobacteraeota bacterium]
MKALVAAVTAAVLASCTSAQQKAPDRTLHDLSTSPQIRELRKQSADAALGARVSAAIAGQAGINVFKLGVTARAGVVTLSGNVPTQDVKRTVVATARSVPGVKRLVAHIDVKS